MGRMCGLALKSTGVASFKTAMSESKLAGWKVSWILVALTVISMFLWGSVSWFKTYSPNLTLRGILLYAKRV
jgi:hypothetical protein